MTGRDRRCYRTSRRVSRPTGSASIRAPPSANAPIRSRVLKCAATRKPNGVGGVLQERKG